jgi:XTP/dITP diphosphohydrolase
MRLLLASQNPGKLREFREILAPAGIDLLDPGDSRLPEVAETGSTHDENALLKARAAAEAFGLAALADDSGLAVDALHGEPGVRSSRYFGPGLSDAQKVQRLLALLQDVPESARGARFVCVAAVAFPDGNYLLRRGECEGRILRAPRGTGGFGYDPVFWVEEFRCSFAELAAEQKSEISHRGRALRKMLDALRGAA